MRSDRILSCRSAFLKCRQWRYASFAPKDSRRSHYGALGVKPDATQDEIKDAFYRLSRQHHPDVSDAHETVAHHRFQEINEAYQVIGEPTSRREYDRQMGYATPMSGSGDISFRRRAHRSANAANTATSERVYGAIDEINPTLMRETFQQRWKVRPDRPPGRTSTFDFDASYRQYTAPGRGRHVSSSAATRAPLQQPQAAGGGGFGVIIVIAGLLCLICVMSESTYNNVYPMPRSATELSLNPDTSPANTSAHVRKSGTPAASKTAI